MIQFKPTDSSTKNCLRRYIAIFIAAIGLAFLPVSPAWADETGSRSAWFKVSDNGEAVIQLYFFWSETCPHCQKARPYVESLETEFPWLKVHSLETSKNGDNARQFVELAHKLGRATLGVPAFLFCGNLQMGYESDATTGKWLRDKLIECRQSIGDDLQGTLAKVPEDPSVHVPFLGEIRSSQWSLPLFTLIIAGMDAFNPCAFFVLLFLLSLLVHAKSRIRMFWIGGIFVFFSGLVYFIFMAAWLNVFLLAGEIRVVTLIAGGVGVVLAVINIKDYFWFKEGVSMSIPESTKPGFYQRVRNLVQATRWTSLTIGTIFLALAANAYELLCTAGFPMVYTRVLTLSKLSTGTYYLYLVLYNLIYIMPLLVIVVGFTVTLGSRKLTENEGRTLKLLSGLMMLSLGLMLLFWPEGLNHAGVAAAILAGAVVGTALIAVGRRVLRRSG